VARSGYSYCHSSVRSGIFVENIPLIPKPRRGDIFPDDVAPTGLESFLSRTTTNMPHLTALFFYSIEQHDVASHQETKTGWRELRESTRILDKLKNKWAEGHLRPTRGWGATSRCFIRVRGHPWPSVVKNFPLDEHSHCIIKPQFCNCCPVRKS
jgi:hypothetical protein